MSPFAKGLLAWPGNSLTSMLPRSRLSALPAGGALPGLVPCVQGSLHAIGQLAYEWKNTDRQCGHVASSWA